MKGCEKTVFGLFRHRLVKVVCELRSERQVAVVVCKEDLWCAKRISVSTSTGAAGRPVGAMFARSSGEPGGQPSAQDPAASQQPTAVGMAAMSDCWSVLAAQSPMVNPGEGNCGPLALVQGAQRMFAKLGAKSGAAMMLQVCEGY